MVRNFLELFQKGTDFGQDFFTFLTFPHCGAFFLSKIKIQNPAPTGPFTSPKSNRANSARRGLLCQFTAGSRATSSVQLLRRREFTELITLGSALFRFFFCSVKLQKETICTVLEVSVTVPEENSLSLAVQLWFGPCGHGQCAESNYIPCLCSVCVVSVTVHKATICHVAVWSVWSRSLCWRKRSVLFLFGLRGLCLCEEVNFTVSVLFFVDLSASFCYCS